MAEKKDRSTALLKLMRRNPNDQGRGLKIIKVKTTEPNPITFIFEGTPLALDLDIFEIPVDMYPLRKDDRLLVYPIVGNSEAERWAAVQKINSGVVLATMQSSTSLEIDRINKTYGASDLIFPKEATLTSGDRVSIAPTLESGVIKYAILEVY